MIEGGLSVRISNSVVDNAMQVSTGKYVGKDVGWDIARPFTLRLIIALQGSERPLS